MNGKNKEVYKNNFSFRRIQLQDGPWTIKIVVRYKTI